MEGCKFFSPSFSYNDADTVELAIAFQDAERGFINAVCNSGNAIYLVRDDGYLKFQSIKLSEVACQSGLTRLENEYLNVLNEINSYAISNDTLTLRKGDDFEVLLTKK